MYIDMIELGIHDHWYFTLLLWKPFIVYIFKKNNTKINILTSVVNKSIFKYWNTNTCGDLSMTECSEWNIFLKNHSSLYNVYSETIGLSKTGISSGLKLYLFNSRYNDHNFMEIGIYYLL